MALSILKHQKMRYILPLLFLFTSFQISAQVFQKYSELGLFGGGAFYFGELNPGRPFYMTRPAAGLVYRYNSSQRFAWRLHGMYGMVEASDANSNVPYQLERNLSFRTRLIEGSAILEFNYFPYEIGKAEYAFTPYMFGGLAGFSFNPEAEFNGEWIELRPLGTEGQGTQAYRTRKLYPLVQVSVPFGFGFKFHVVNRIGIALEWGLRATFTDYFDDVSSTYADPDALIARGGAYAAFLADRSLTNPGKSNVGRQRGNPTTNDIYSMAGLIITVRLSGKEAQCAAYK